MPKTHDLQQIREYLNLGFEQRLFEASLDQLSSSQDPLRANNFAYSLRELTRHVLKRLAPDHEVREAPWFKQDPNTDITRAQRMKFAIQGHLPDGFLKTHGIDYDQEAAALKACIDGLSKYTHINEDTFDLTPEETDKLADDALGAFANLFRSMFDCRERTLNAVEGEIDNEVVDHVIGETLEGFWQFATHYTAESVDIESIELSAFEGDEIIGSVSGSVSVTLQYGSAGDLRRGDGLETSASAGFSCDVRIMASDLKHIEIVEDSFTMDYSELEEGWGEEDESGDL